MAPYPSPIHFDITEYCQPAEKRVCHCLLASSAFAEQQQSKQ